MILSRERSDRLCHCTVIEIHYGILTFVSRLNDIQPLLPNSLAPRTFRVGKGSHFHN
jgi:hypothetical protein